MSNFRNLFILFLFWISNLFVKNASCAIGLLGDDFTTLDLDLGSLDLEKIKIIKSLDKPVRFKINPREQVLINSISLLGNTLWTKLGVNVCHDVVIYIFEAPEVVISPVINDGGIKKVYYIKKTGNQLTFINLLSFLTLIHDEFKPKDYLIPQLLDISEGAHKVFYKYNIIMLGDLIHEKYEPSDNSGFTVLMDGMKTIWDAEHGDSKGKLALSIEIFEKVDRLKMLRITIQDSSEMHFIMKENGWNPLLVLGFMTNFKRLEFGKIFDAQTEKEKKPKDLDPLPKVLDVSTRDDSFIYTSCTLLNMNFLTIKPMFEFLTKKIIDGHKIIHDTTLCKFQALLIRLSDPVKCFLGISINESVFSNHDIYFERSDADGNWEPVTQSVVFEAVQQSIVEFSKTHYLKSADLYGVWTGVKVADLSSKVKSLLTGQEFAPTPIPTSASATPSSTPIPTTPVPETSGSLPALHPGSAISTPPPTPSTALPSYLVSSQTGSSKPSTPTPMTPPPSTDLVPDKLSATGPALSPHPHKKPRTEITKPSSPTHLTRKPSPSLKDPHVGDDSFDPPKSTEPRHRKPTKPKYPKPTHEYKPSTPTIPEHSTTYTEYTIPSSEYIHGETGPTLDDTELSSSLTKDKHTQTDASRELVITYELLEKLKQDIIEQIVEILKSGFSISNITITSLTLLPILLI